jgi:hypothetical protein
MPFLTQPLQCYTISAVRKDRCSFKMPETIRVSNLTLSAGFVVVPDSKTSTYAAEAHAAAEQHAAYPCHHC